MSDIGLRERKKHQTREALIDAAFELFSAQGYETTTIDQIAAQAGVSPRTFFRYFGGKEELALDFTVEFEELVTAALAVRPEDEPPLTALVHAFRSFLQAMRASAGEDRERFLRHRRVIDGNPALLAASFARMAAIEDRLAVEVARRQGTDPATDMRPHLIVALVTSAMRVGYHCPAAGADQLERLTGNIEATLTLIEQAVRPGWDQLSLGSSGQVATKASSPG